METLVYYLQYSCNAVLIACCLFLFHRVQFRGFRPKGFESRYGILFFKYLLAAVMFSCALDVTVLIRMSMTIWMVFRIRYLYRFGTL